MAQTKRRLEKRATSELCVLVGGRVFGSVVVLNVVPIDEEWPSGQDRAPDFRLVTPGTSEEQPTEAAECWIGWNAAGFHLFARMEDSEIVPGLSRDEALHFRHGDTLELFLAPAGARRYAEMYATPAGRKATLFFRAPRGEPQPDPLAAHGYRGLRVRSRTITGGWEAEMHVPAEDLRAWGGAWEPGAAWTLLVGRYNHGSRFVTPELSAFPPLPAVDFHRTADYARLVLQSASIG